MEQVPDWLSLGVAIVGLFLGGAGGTYYGARQRLRLEDRRSLLEDHVSVFLRGPEQDAGPNRDPILVEFSEYFNVWAPLTNLMVAIARSPATVRLLPWRDRALWRRISRELFESRWSSVYVRLFHEFYQGRYRTDPDLRLRLGRTLELDERLVMLITDAESGQWDEYRKSVRDFQNHLIRQINPTFSARFEDLRQTLDLLVHGPRPWSSEIRITRSEPYVPEDRNPAVDVSELLQ